MGRYILRRLLESIPVLFLASVAIFFMIHFIPGDPALIVLGPNATTLQYEAMVKRMGLDKPLYVQYGIWLGRVLRGDFGASYLNRAPVFNLIMVKAKATVELALGGIVVAALFAFPIGIFSAIRRGSLFDKVATAFVSLAYAMPTFWLGLLLVILFAVELRWLPASGRAEPSRNFALFLKLLILPSLTLGIPISAVLARFLKMSLLEVLNQDYVRTARAKGLAEQWVIYRHALRNALIPVVTILGLEFGALLGGAVVTESIFAWPGIGSMLLHAIQTRDYTIVQGTVLLVVVVFIVVNLAVDVSYAFLDPRIRYQ